MPTKNDILQCALVIGFTPLVILLLMVADAGISIADVQWALGYWLG
ncbi:TMhelix containing protein [Vibrio phage 1.031.O._10N.261.46.F8]|nr:TMhelix containing protein [Vibrio phage 1.031.O._10N.261.46.F8]